MVGHVPMRGHGATAFLALSLLFVIAFSTILGDAALALESSKRQSSGSINVNVELVVLHATVHDRKGHIVRGLPRDDFRVYEDGQLQTIKLFRDEDVPVAVGLVVDSSGSMQQKRRDVVAAVSAFIRSSNAEDDMFVVNFNEKVDFGLLDTPLVSANAWEVDRALLAAPAQGMTALYDSIEIALSHVERAARDKKVLIVISDGGDNASTHTLNQVLQDASQSDVIIYTIGLYDEDDTERNSGVLKRIARATGGAALFPHETSDIVASCQIISTDIRNQYTIGYTPSNEKLDGSYRTIKVTANGPHDRKLLVRTRAGYIASPNRNSASRTFQDATP